MRLALPSIDGAGLTRLLAHSTELGQVSNQFVGPAVGQAVLRGVAGEIFERQNRQSRDVRRATLTQLPVPQSADIQADCQYRQQGRCKTAAQEYFVGIERENPVYATLGFPSRGSAHVKFVLLQETQ